jgi:hypothetical protein
LNVFSTNGCCLALCALAACQAGRAGGSLPSSYTNKRTANYIGGSMFLVLAAATVCDIATGAHGRYGDPKILQALAQPSWLAVASKRVAGVLAKHPS